MLLFLYFLTGITFAFAAVNLIIGLQKESDRSYLFLSLIGICVGLYYLFFTQSLSGNIFTTTFKTGMFFFLANFGLLPWFLCSYTGYCKKQVQWILTGGMALSFLILIFTRDFSHPIIWNITGHIFLIGIILFGLRAAHYQRNKGHKSSAVLLFGSLIILALFTLDDIVRIHFNAVYPFIIPENVLPLDYFLVFFMILMGLRLAQDIQQKYRLEKFTNLQEKRWKTLLEKVELLIVGISADGTINYVNPHFCKVSGYTNDDLLQIDYFKHFLPLQDREKVLKAFHDSLNKNVHSYVRNSILTKAGEELLIDWSNVILENSEGKVVSTISIGSDITEQERACEEIESIKRKLEEENILLKAEMGKIPTSEKIVGHSDALQYVLQKAMQVASTDSTVLLEGETGVGKELIANYIQQNSQRKDKPFIKLNCAAIPPALLESELFGHLKGAFTGAERLKKGMVEMADGGTLLLDEIGEFPLELQPKLLRFLQEGEFMPLGGESSKKVDVRIIAATNRELLKEIEKGRFRNDLYYRLYVYPITIPPLRSRKKDIRELIDFFVKRFAKKHLKKITKVSKLVVNELTNYPWPGNIRELENVLERAVIVCNADTIRIRDIGPVISEPNQTTKSNKRDILHLEEAEREHILRALNHTNWKIHGTSGAAELLGINPSTLRSRIKKLNITKS